MPSLYELQQAEQPQQTLPPEFQKAAAINAAAQRAYDKVRTDPTLSPAGKQQRLAPLYLASQRQMAAHAAELAAATVARKSQLARAAFGVPTDPIQAMSYRNAVAVAEQIDHPTTAGQKLSRALDTGDPLLAQAIAQHAADQGWTDVLNTYIAAKPTVGDALVELNEITAQQDSIHHKFAEAAHLRVGKPDELARMADHQIEALAAETTGS